MNPKMNVLARLEFELAYYDVAVQHEPLCYWDHQRCGRAGVVEEELSK